MRTIQSYNIFCKTINFNIFQKVFIMRRSIFLAFFGFMLTMPLFAQTRMVKADSIVANPGDSIDVAIRVQNLPQIGSLTLYIEFSNSVLDFGRALNINPLLASGYPLINIINANKIVVSWADINGVTLGTDKLFDLRFKYKSGISQIHFTYACEVTNISGDLLSPDVDYQDGSVTQSLTASIVSTGNSVCLGNSMLLTAHAEYGYGNYTYNWSSIPAGLSSNSASVTVIPNVNTIYTVNVSDGVVNLAESKTIIIFTDPQPASVSNMVPANNTQNIANTSVQLSWSPAAYATSYDLYIWSADSINRPFYPEKSNLTSINYLKTDLFYGKSYKWQVVSRNLCHITNGPVFQFSIRNLPELHVTQITTSQAYAGQPLTISWTVKNDGLGSTGNQTWNDFIWISPDIEVRVAEDMILGQFQNVSYLNAGQSYTNTVQVNLPNNIMGTYYIFLVTDANDALFIDWSLTGNGPNVAPVPYTPSTTGIPYPYIKAWSHINGNIQEVSDAGQHNDNFFYKQLDVIMPPVPDLIVNQIIAPSNVFSGQSITLPFSVINQGYATASGNLNDTVSGNWNEVVYISSDTVFNPSTAILLGTFPRFLILQPDSIYYKNVQINIPPNILGTYYFYVKTDATNQVFENVYETNNITKSTAFQIFLTPPPDLIVTNIQAPNVLSNKETVNVTFTVKNQGAIATSSNTWIDKIFLTNTSNYDLSNAILLKSETHNGNLEPDSFYTITTNVVIPKGISGSYYFYVKTDANYAVFEYTDDSNNVTRKLNPSIINTPDLIVTKVDMPLFENNNQPVIINWTVKNLGSGKLISESITDNVFVSKYNIFNPDSITLAGSKNYILNLNSGDSIDKSISVSLPLKISGTYYVYISTDYANKVFESPSELNNTTKSIYAIQINKPDLMVIGLTHPTSFNTGQSTTIDWKVKNNGQGNILNKKWTDKIYLSKYSIFHKDSVTEIASESYIISQLIGSDSILKTITFTMPGKPGDNYYLYIYTDAKDTIYEGVSENNNTYRSINTIPVFNPNLIVSNVNYQSSINSGQNIQIEWSMKNIGLGKLFYSNISDKIYFSSSLNFHQDSVVQIGIKNYNISLLPNDSINNVMNVTIPNGISGNYYIFIHTNFNQSVYEGGLYNDNKNRGSQLTVGLSPWVDLQLIQLIVPDSITPGDYYSIDFSVKNNGITATSGQSWIDKLYISSYPDFDTSAILLSTYLQSQYLNLNSIYQNNFTSILPNSFSSGYYFIFATTDVNNSIYEYLYENNNIVRSNPVYINPYPVNLEATSFTVPDTASSGQNIILQWAVTNNSNKVTLPSYWYDAVYLSTDSIWNPGSDMLLKQFKKDGPLLSNTSYLINQNILIPNGLSGIYYILMVTDYMNANNEQNTIDNRIFKKINNQTIPLYIKLTPSPDLIVSYFTAPQQVNSGQPFKVYFKIQNQGVGSTTIGNWTDKIYLSSDFTINQGDNDLGTLNYNNGILSPGQFYIDTLEITIPVSFSGNYILIYKTDNTNTVFEHTNENNNTANAFILSSQPPPADIVVRNITSPINLMVDKMDTIKWDLVNIGTNPANGWIKDMIYLSSDTIWDVNDKMLGSKYQTVNLPSLGTQNREIYTKIPGVAIGDYYIIVKTDILNGIYEINDTNNTSYSSLTTNIDMKRLQFNTFSNDTLNNNTDLYYLIEVPDTLQGETMLSTLKADSINGSNEMYLKFNQLSTRLNYDFTHLFPYLGNQEMLVPYLLKGNYYLMLYGRTLVSNKQEIKIKPEILQFDVRSINSNKGGNTGKITVALSGSKFNSFMKVRLAKGNDTIYADTLIYVDLTKVFVRFNLKDANPGLYNVIVEHLCEGTIEIANGFEIKNGSPNFLSVNAVAPNNVRKDRNASFTIEYANLGNTDIIAPAIDIISYSGSPIALSTSNLSINSTHLHIPLQIAGEPSNILRPGVTGSIVIYTRTSGGLGFTINVTNQ